LLVRRINALVEVKALVERRDYLERLHGKFSETTLGARVDVNLGRENNKRYLETLARFQDDLTVKLQAGLNSRVAAAKAALEESEAALTNEEGRLKDAEEVKKDLGLNCETFDQALESILREVRLVQQLDMPS